MEEIYECIDFRPHWYVDLIAFIKKSLRKQSESG